MFACGNNDNGQLGLGDTTSRNTFTAVPELPDGKVAKQVVGGLYHTMILRARAAARKGVGGRAAGFIDGFSYLSTRALLSAA